MDKLIRSGRAWKFNKTDFIITAENFKYVQPEYIFSAEKPIQQSQYVIFSAPGAVGKSAFGLHLALTKNAMLWDLAKLRLGSNTFIGSIQQAVGVHQLADFLASIESGETLLVFDAFDEAELHSGWSGVEEFLRDVVSLTSKSNVPSVLFLARRSTAEMLEIALSDLLHDDVNRYMTASIGFFSKGSATQFVLNQIEKTKGPQYCEKNKGVLKQKAIEAFSMPVAGKPGTQNSDEWDSPEHERFFGYAPVLQTIAALLADTDNPYTQSFDKTGSSYATIVANILRSIQNRESEKFHAAANQRFSSDKSLDLSSLYSESDQLRRLLAYLNCDDTEAYSVPSTFDAKISAQLIEMLQNFLPQHPFLNGKDFAGPAFRDFILAKGLSSEELRLATDFWIETKQPLPTPILATLYNSVGKGKANSADIELLYESVNSGSLSGKSSLLLFVDENDSTKLSIEIHSDETNALGESFAFQADAPETIKFVRKLNNAQIITKGRVSFGRKDQAFDFIDSEVKAQQICFLTSRLRVRCEGSGLSRLESNENIQSPIGMRIDVSSGHIFCVVAPNSKNYPWTTYSSDVSHDAGIDDVRATLHVMARVLGWFRKDKRKDYGRYKDLIVKHVVGSSFTARYALGFIQHIGALSEKDNMYFIDTDKLDLLELSWQKIRNNTISETAITAVRDYLQSTPEPPLF